MDEEILAQLAEFDDILAEPLDDEEEEEVEPLWVAPYERTNDEILDQIKSLETPLEKAVGRPPVVERTEIEEAEPPVEIETTLTSGKLVLEYKRSVVKRDEQGRIVEIIGDGVRKMVRRDESGRITEIISEEETES